jgi:succinate-semialdehyde dehydrogenase / glutarate-semialdehyde dehydrogenase
MDNIITTNPATGERIGETPTATAQEVQTAVAVAKQAFSPWRDLSINERAAYAGKLVTILKKNTETLAALITREMGKPLSESKDEITWEIEFIEWYIDNAQRLLGEKTISEDDHAIYKTVYEPYGVCASIAPWNFPITMASTGITAQLIAGNTVVFKPSEYTTLSQKMFVDLYQQTGLPSGVLQCLPGDSTVGKMLVESDIDMLWFTGSTKVGQELYKKCAEKFIPCLLELGGSSPGIVFADCDFEKTVETVFQARFYNCGQVCNALKRLYVETPLYEKFTAALVERVKKAKIGNPQAGAEMGPLVSKKQMELLVTQVDDAKNKGATIHTGGNRLEGKEFAKGNFYQPTVITGATPDMQVYAEEVFGPVLPITPFDTEEQAIQMANDTQYGLSALIFTGDSQKANRVARQVQAGGVSVNMDLSYKPFAPMGGFKKSGIGREYGEEGFKELAQLKYICIAK